ncbi:hypothetical protein Poli38472_001189 [Pythium oligandrum]|uniref:Crinkler effector protein N-terminal domain-containing protein n=1 Tax=Pythium oligandrum TaxID=41045 RepID=A0A8K1CU69_PYTOL|nr:hypothetical protein Poli38472_001189 [Pythium oligandrum]|eukprot:TMW69033.1 hypothetical protein Poli38472_001189 [Pythium oligandrum]
MVSVRCMLLHTVGTRLFSVSIADDKTVEDLHLAIAKAKPNELGGIDPDRLQLFLTKKNDVWLTMCEINILRNVEGLQSLEPFYISPLRVAGLSRDDITDEGGKTGPWQASMHLVVVVKRKLAVELDNVPANKLSTFDMMLKQFSKAIALPTRGDFLCLFDWDDEDIGTLKDIAVINNVVGCNCPSLIVRKEILCVLKNFIFLYEDELDEGKGSSNQFILVGNPGVGKSCILALLCFYIAAKHSRTVVWYKQVPGGNLREFLPPDANKAKGVMREEVNRVTATADANKLLTSIAFSPIEQIDLIRMQGVMNVNNVEHYILSTFWICCVTSKLVLQHIAEMVGTDFFVKLMKVARGMGDERLESVAFEGYFHVLVRHQQGIQLHLCKYLNWSRGGLSADQKIPPSIGTLPWTRLPIVVEDLNHSYALMATWATNLSQMDYWIPRTSLVETVDAVAKWTNDDGSVDFVLLQLTKAPKHKCNAAVLVKLARPLIDRGYSVRYIAIVPAENTKLEFRFIPGEFDVSSTGISLEVAHLEVLTTDKRTERPSVQRPSRCICLQLAFISL